MSDTTKRVVLLLGITTLAAGGYVAYSIYKKKKSKDNLIEVSEEETMEAPEEEEDVESPDKFIFGDDIARMPEPTEIEKTEYTTKAAVYSEYEEDNPSNKLTSVIKVEGDKKVTLIRNGEDRTRLVLEKGKRHQCFYNTGFGNMMVGVFTQRIDADLSDDGGQLEVSYSLDINSGLTSINQIFIDIKKGTDGNNVTNIN